MVNFYQFFYFLLSYISFYIHQQISFFTNFEDFIQHYLKKEFCHKFPFNKITQSPLPHSLNGQSQLSVTKTFLLMILTASQVQYPQQNELQETWTKHLIQTLGSFKLDFKNLTFWLDANRISLKVKKTELVIFKHQRKKLDSPIKIKHNCKTFYPSKLVKYFGIKIDENLNWKQHIHGIAIKLNRANALLSVIRNYVNKHTLRIIYFAIFDSHINYVNLIWGQNLHALSRIIILQKKALRIMNSQSRDSLKSIIHIQPYSETSSQNTYREYSFCH